MATNYEKTVAAMSPQDMELLIRAYVRLHIHPKSEGYGGTVAFHFSGQISSRDTESRPGIWKVGAEYGDSDQSKGEVLSAVAAEYYRRVGWTASSAASLLLIEGTAIEAPTAPF